MKNNLIINLTSIFISVLNIPNDYPLVTIVYKCTPIITKSFIVRDITFEHLKWSTESKGECIVSFMEAITETTKFMPSQLIEDIDVLDRFLGYISILLKYNNKNDPHEIVDLDKYNLKKHNVLLDKINIGLWMGEKYKVTFNGLEENDGIYEIKDITDNSIVLNGDNNDLILDLIQILYLDMKFERVS